MYLLNNRLAVCKQVSRLSDLQISKRWKCTESRSKANNTEKSSQPTEIWKMPQYASRLSDLYDRIEEYAVCNARAARVHRLIVRTQDRPSKPW